MNTQKLKDKLQNLSEELDSLKSKILLIQHEIVSLKLFLEDNYQVETANSDYKSYVYKHDSKYSSDNYHAL